MLGETKKRVSGKVPTWSGYNLWQLLYYTTILLSFEKKLFYKIFKKGLLEVERNIFGYIPMLFLFFEQLDVQVLNMKMGFSISALGIW